MKNVFFVLAFMLVGSFGFANSNVENRETINSKVEFSENIQTLNLSTDLNIVEQINNILDEDDWICARLYVNGDFVGYVCGETIGEIIDKVIDMFF